MAPTGLLPSFLAAIQASLSVLLVISYGAFAAHSKLLQSPAAKSISKVSVKIFLPALLLTKLGSQIEASSAYRYLLILGWAFICHFLSFLLGLAAHLLLGMPDWITAAVMFNNTTSYPLLLIQSLHATGILASLVQGHQETEEAIERAKSYFLVFATVSSCLTFAVGPRLIDSEHAPEGVGKKEEEDREEDEGEEEDVMEIGGGVNEESGLLTSRSSRVSLMSVSFFPSKPRDMAESMVQDRRPTIVAEKRRHHMSDRTRWWLLFLYDFLNAPLLGAVLGAIIGLVPAFHRAFFADTEDGGFFSAWLTASLTSVGSLFVPLPVVVAGVSLYTAMEKTNKGQAGGTPWLTTLFVLVVRFAIWPVISIAVIYTLAHRTNILGDDPMLWFTMMLMPTGPPAMKLITMVEVSDADEEDEHKISKLLTISYIISPVLAFTVVGTLRAAQAAIT